jgi:hypothetical protein
MFVFLMKKKERNEFEVQSVELRAVKDSVP